MSTNMPTVGGTTPPGPFAVDTLLTLSEIADLTGRDLKTVKVWNNKGKGRWPHAVQDQTGRKAWRVPVTDLVASGDLGPAQVLHVENELAARRESRETKALREQVVRLEEQLAAAQEIARERAESITFLRGLLTQGRAA